MPNLPAADGRLPTIALAALAGIGATFSPASPTGHQPFDAIVLVSTIGLATWAAARAPWWILTSAGGLAAALAFDPAGFACGVAGALAGLWRGWDRRSPEAVGALAAGLALNGLCRIGDRL